MKARAKKSVDELRPEYDLSQLLASGVKGKYAKRYEASTNLVLIEPEIHNEFRTAQEVNDALRLVIKLRRIGATPRRVSR